MFEDYVTEFDPVTIHTNEFDQILNVELQVFSDLFNNDLGKGGWENINEAHYQLIDAELNKITNQGKKVVIIFGSGHKGWLLNKLKTRTDIVIKNLLDII